MGSMTLQDLQGYNGPPVVADLLVIAGGVDLEDVPFPEFDYLLKIRDKFQYKYAAFSGNAYAIDTLRSIYPGIIHFNNIVNRSSESQTTRKS